MWKRWALAAALIGLFAGKADTQTAPLLRVFLDCNRCDENYLTENVAFVDYVRDRTVAGLHVLVTTQETGAGGLQWTVAFIGQGRYTGQDRTLTFNTLQDATDDERRKEFARIFKLGLVGYAADTTVAPQLDVTYTKSSTAGQTTSRNDPWNYWVFRLSTGGNFNGEASSHNENYRFSGSANRTSNNWKVDVEGSGNSERNTFHFDDEDIVSRSDSWNINSLIVKSAGPHWSFGSRGAISHSSVSNDQRTIAFGPAVEYDIFPYSESTRRLLTLRYSVNFDFHQYQEVTILDRLEETTPSHSLHVQLNLQQPWGSLNLSANTLEHLNDLSRRRLSLFSNADVRLFKGFSFDYFGGYDKINDLIGLRKGEASTEDVLLKMQQLATDYSYFFGFGISYRFGSIFNNIVNPRFGN